MPSSNILLVGNCIVDEVFLLPFYPSEDDEIRALGRTRTLGGNACNSARILAQLGHEVSLQATQASDDLSRWIRDELDVAGIDHHLCRSQSGHTTPLSSIWLNQQTGSRSIVHYRDLPELQRQELARIDPTNYQWIHFEGRNVETLAEILPALTRYPVPLSLEIEKPREGIEQLCQYVNTIIVSSQYLESRRIDAESCLYQFRRLNSDASIVCTLGKEGLVAMDKIGQIIKIAAEPVCNVIDTIGAGDCFIAGLIHASLQPRTFEDALIFANRLAGNKIQHRGMVINLEI